MIVAKPHDLVARMRDVANAGAYAIEGEDREAFEVAARELGFATTTIDLAGCVDRTAVIQRLAIALAFPAWFGGNWDALADCLADLSWRPAAGYLLLLDNAGAWRGSSPEDFAVLIDILAEAAARWAIDDIPFWAVVPLNACRHDASPGFDAT